MKGNRFLTAIALIGSGTKWAAIMSVIAAFFWLMVIVGRKILDEIISCFRAWPRGCTIILAVIASPLIIFGLIKFWRWSYDYLCDLEYERKQQIKKCYIKQPTPEPLPETKPKEDKGEIIEII